MKWKRWKAGLAVAAATGVLTGCLGLSIGMTGRQILILLGANFAKDVLLYLKDHPVEEALDA